MPGRCRIVDVGGGFHPRHRHIDIGLPGAHLEIDQGFQIGGGQLLALITGSQEVLVLLGHLVRHIVAHRRVLQK